MVVIVGLLVAGALAAVSSALYTNNENRLLDLRVREVGSVLAQAQPSVQTPLASAAALADATNGNVRKFRRFVAPYVGPPPAHQFVSVSLWRLGATQRGPIAVVGEPPALSASASESQAFFAKAAHTPTLNVIGLLALPRPRLGYGFTTPESTSRFAAYGESLLPTDRRSPLQTNAAFSDLDYALYLGRSERPADLLVTDLSHLPIRGRQAKETVPFGDSVLTLVGLASCSAGRLVSAGAPVDHPDRRDHSDRRCRGADMAPASAPPGSRGSGRESRASRRGEPAALRRAAQDRADPPARAASRGAATDPGGGGQRTVRAGGGGRGDLR